jgi:hypothetical protein
MEKMEVSPRDPSFSSNSRALGASIEQMVQLDREQAASAQTV